jgi:hypothetical protein
MHIIAGYKATHERIAPANMSNKVSFMVIKLAK